MDKIDNVYINTTEVMAKNLYKQGLLVFKCASGYWVKNARYEDGYAIIRELPIDAESINFTIEEAIDTCNEL